MPPIPCIRVDAFTSEPYRGNPAGVFLLDSPAAEAWMQSVSAEMNLSECAYVSPLSLPNAYQLRWFTPKTEVSLCGHATLAAAHALFETGAVDPNDTLHFHTKSGILSITKDDAGINMVFPTQMPEPADLPDNLFPMLGLQPVWTGVAGKKFMLLLSSAEEVYNCKPDFAALLTLPGRGLIITAPSDRPEYDFISRYFAPWVGVNEDPVTGSAHRTLAPFWAAKLDKNRLTAFQASARSGVVRLELLPGEEVKISGQCTTISKGQWFA